MLRSLVLVVMVAGLLSACGGSDRSAENAPVEISKEAYKGSGEFLVNTSDSKINWTGSMSVGGKQHTGTLMLKQGKAYVKNGELVGGEFTLDMSSITNKDMSGEEKEKLEGHLASADFFNVEKFPTATFEIASLTKVDTLENGSHLLTGNLTMKGITKSVEMPVTNLVINSNHVAVRTATFTIDRTLWDVKFKSGLFGTAKDKAISDEIELRVSLRADSADFIRKQQELNSQKREELEQEQAQ